MINFAVYSLFLMFIMVIVTIFSVKTEKPKLLFLDIVCLFMIILPLFYIRPFDNTNLIKIEFTSDLGEIKQCLKNNQIDDIIQTEDDDMCLKIETYEKLIWFNILKINETKSYLLVPKLK